MYPLKFENLYFEKIWGGRDLELFRDNLPEGSIGESWDIACHPHGSGIVANGKYKGRQLGQLVKEFGSKLMGTKIDLNWFPLLIKLINAKDKLSVQVHPDDAYALATEGEMGKTEAWYVVEAFHGANLVVGTKGCNKEQFKEAIEKGDFDKYMNKIPVNKGEVYFIKSGLIHAIGEGVIIAEIQQNSDTTYRVYDYNRGRELHLEKAMDVIDFNIRGEKCQGITEKQDDFQKTSYCFCEHFSLKLYDIYKSLQESSDIERFYTFTCVEGEGRIIYSEGIEIIKKGDSILVPAQMGCYVLEGTMKLLKSYVPDVERARREL